MYDSISLCCVMQRLTVAERLQIAWLELSRSQTLVLLKNFLMCRVVYIKKYLS